MSAFAPLLMELDRWADAGRSASLWLRDDDAVEPTLALNRLLGVTRLGCVPVVIASVPEGAAAALASRLAQESHVHVWQHGIAHTNHAPAGDKKQELVSAALPILDGLKEGRRRLWAMFGAQFEPVLVPPWNRISPALIPLLPGLGFAGLSCFKPRTAAIAAPGLWQVNTHVDLIDWRGGGRFIGAGAAVQRLADILGAQRLGQADPDEPTGLLSHHLIMPDEAWGFLSALFTLTNEHPGVRWCAPTKGCAASG